MARPKGYVKEMVLDRAMELFSRQGYEGAHLAALVDYTGLNRFSLYKEFGGKAGLYEAALERFLAGLLAQYRQQLTQMPLGLGNIEAALRGVLGSRHSGAGFMLSTLMQKDTVPPEAFEKAVAASEEIETLYHANLVSAAASGEIDVQANLAGLGRMLQTLDQGLHMQGLAGARLAQQERVIAAAMAVLRKAP